MFVLAQAVSVVPTLTLSIAEAITCALVWHSTRLYLLIVTLSQIGAPAASTRFTPYVFLPIPWTVATIIEPPADPAFGEISVSFGVKVKPASRTVVPRPFPFSW